MKTDGFVLVSEKPEVTKIWLVYNSPTCVLVGEEIVVKSKSLREKLGKAKMSQQNSSDPKKSV